MKLIIEIPEVDYNYAKQQVADGITNPLKIFIASGIPLGKIRTEIEALPRELPTDARNMVRRTRVLDIINKYR